MTSAWAGAVARFLNPQNKEARSEFLNDITQGFIALTGRMPSAQQAVAWELSYDVLEPALTALVAEDPDANEYHLIFEYELPGEGGRRPDVVLLAADIIVVIEVKANKSGVHAADLDQTRAYARDIAHYHQVSHGREVRAALLLTARTQADETRGEVEVVSAATLADYLRKLEPAPSPIDPQAWLESPYAPLPSIIKAARHVFNAEPLPFIRRAESAGIPQVMDFLQSLSEQARMRGERHIVLVTGVPGAGKTLVGLQYVYATRQADDTADAIFLSGNGPLVQVLQYALKSKTFVRPIRNFYIQHAVKRESAPAEHFIVFDEAQRAWDAERMGEKYGHAKTAPELITEIASRVPDYALVLALVGEGQEIHIGEEEGVEQWGRALKHAGDAWTLHSPEKFEDVFAGSGKVKTYPFLDLNTSLRSHLASDVQRWVAHVLDGEIEAAAALADTIRAAGFSLYITRDLDTAKAYCGKRYEGEPGKRYGLLASSKAKNLAKYNVHNDYQSTLRVKTGPFFIDPPESALSCCQLDKVVTEFACQGLELDLPVICWGTDLRWEDGAWRSAVTGRSKAKDPHRLRLNAYRVLLTRGRDGLVVFAPPDKALAQSYEVLLESGLMTLKGAHANA